MVTPVIVAGLILAAVWGLYLLPGMFGERRSTPLNSTEEFDRLTRVIADVQRRAYDARLSNNRDQMRTRRRRALAALIVIAIATLVVAWRRQSLNWLLVHIGIDACLAWYLAMLSQIRQRQAQQLANRYAENTRRVTGPGRLPAIVFGFYQLDHSSVSGFSA
jgi:Flp pilus assembly protein TadB